MIKIVLLITLFSTSSFLGFQISQIYHKKTAFFEDLKSFIKATKTQISFLKVDLITLIKSTNYSSELGKLLANFSDMLNSGVDISESKVYEMVSKNIVLEDNEKNLVSKMLFELGKLKNYEKKKKLSFY